MPALPIVSEAIATAAAIASDSRVLDSRQLIRRQNTGLPAIPLFYQYGGPAPGAVAGIVLGSVAGFLLLIWLFWSLSNGGGFIRGNSYEEEDVVIRRRERSGRRSSRHTEMTSRSPVRRERVIRQERIVRDINPGPREPSRIRETVIVDDGPRVERRVEGDDIVEVIEEHSSIGAPPRRSGGRRSSGYRRGLPGDFSDI